MLQETSVEKIFDITEQEANENKWKRPEKRMFLGSENKIVFYLCEGLTQRYLT